MNIIFLGDSILSRYPSKYSLSIDGVSSSSNIINLAEGGMRASDLFSLARASKFSQGTIFIVCIGINDAHQNESLEKFKRNIQSTTKILTKSGMTILLDPPPVDIINDYSSGMGFNKQLWLYSEALKQVADQKTRTVFVSGTLEYQEMMASGVDVHEEDGVHLNETGYAVLFETLNHALNLYYCDYQKYK